MRVIYGDEFFNVEVDLASARLEVVRSKRVFKSTSEMLVSLDGMMTAIEAAQAGSYGLLIDFRSAPEVGDFGYQRAMFHFDQFLSNRFRSIVVVHAQQKAVDAPPNSVRDDIHYFLTIEGARRALTTLQSSAPQMPHKSS